MWMWDFYTSYSTTILVFLLTLCIVYLNTRRSALVPPGPSLWPVIGNLPCLIKDPMEALESLRQLYGDIVGLYIGNQLTVFVNRYDAIHEVLVKRGTLFSWRPETDFWKQIIKTKSIVFANGEQWKANRHFAQITLQMLCFNNESLCVEKMITEELSHFIVKLTEINKPTDIATDISLSTANVMFSILHGYRSGYTDSNLLWYLDTMRKEVKTFRNSQLIADCFPFLLNVPGDPLRMVNYYKQVDKNLAKHFDHYCLKDYDTFTKGQEYCFVHYLISALKVKDKKDWEVELARGEVWILLHDLMVAGSETTATTIRWILLYMIKQPEVQSKAKDCVYRVLGKTETPSLKHRKQLPYVEALILEGLRLGQVVPLGLPHSAAQDVTIRGYQIPKNTTILLNLASISRDPNVFEDPNTFKPERFLSSDGQQVIVPKEFMPFAKGPRSCLGESIARIELFLYMTTLLQKFKFFRPEQTSMPEAKGELGVTYSPKPYKLKIISE